MHSSSVQIPIVPGLIFFALLSFASAFCKSTPGSSGWPSPSEWQQLNQSLSNYLLKPLPPAAPCHTNEPTYNQQTCSVIQAQWTNGSWHAENPISVDSNNWSNDSCLPMSSAPCSGSGYPVYVVNASTASHVQTAVNFARKNSIRLVVKGTGHDYLGRSIGPNSLSIWTHNMRGLTFHKSFQPKGCNFTIDTTAVTMMAGEQWGNIYAQAGLVNQVVVGPGPASVGIGGYLTGGGHSTISGLYGTGADQVLEMDVVTASGEILTVNECQNTDLFWALRGGGGSTFAVIISITVKTFPSTPVTSFNVTLLSAVNSTAYWGVSAYMLSQYPKLIDAGMFGYVFTGGSYSGPEISGTAAVYLGTFLAPNKSMSEVAEVLLPLGQYINTTWPGQITLDSQSHSWPSYYDWWEATITDIGSGYDYLVGNRLLDGEALSKPQDTLIQALKDTTPPGSLININLIAGPGVWNAKPRGGNDSINPAWRKAYVEYAIPSGWASSSKDLQAAAIDTLTKQWIPALDNLAGSNSGCYINEDNPYDTSFPSVFWGSNYDRLLSIKRSVDPDDVFWCYGCVGRDRWVENDQGVLCQASTSTNGSSSTASGAAATGTKSSTASSTTKSSAASSAVDARGMKWGWEWLVALIGLLL